MKSPRSYIERLISINPFPYYWGGTIIGVLFFLFSAYMIISLEKSNQYILSCFFLSSLISLQCVLIYWAHQEILLQKDVIFEMIDLSKEMTSGWHEHQEAMIFNYKRMFFVGVAITIMAHFLELDQFNISFNSIYSNYIFKFDYYFAHYLMGAGLYVWIATTVMIYRITKLPLDINILLSKNIRFCGKVYSKFIIGATIVYSIWGAFYLSTPARLSSPHSIVWFSSFALVLLANFMIPQLAIYGILIKIRTEKLKNLQLYMQKKAEEAYEYPTKFHLFKLNNILSVQEQIDELCIWPFGGYEVAHILLIVIIPLAILLIEVLLKIANNE